MSSHTEQWRDIPGYEGIYKVSNTGLMASYDREINGRKMKGRILKVSASKPDTSKFNLCTGYRSVSVSRTAAYLVLITFVGEPPRGNDSRACHKDGDHKNNRLENLFWGVHAPNAKEKKLSRPTVSPSPQDSGQTIKG